ncbi:MAG: 3-oxoacyl-[acyl-carrier-protein] reductase, partial [Candidatus Omnitrophica bacterium]|nr:3-oxoacyl-[acyl-carrier-protein] reductase [Candidatus Omnitrophota bacterium]
AKVVICDVNEEELAKAKKELDGLGSTALVFKVDVTSLSHVEEMTRNVLDNLGKIDILINNAGITKDALLLRLDEADWDKVIAVNLKGTFNCTKAVSKVMLKQRQGKIVNIASVIGLIGNAGQANYAASKAGIIGLTKSVAREFASRGITVNAVAPGFIQTEMTDKLPQEIREQMLKQIPAGRFGSPSDVANASLFLVSEAAGYITGQVIVVDGGMVM